MLASESLFSRNSLSRARGSSRTRNEDRRHLIAYTQSRFYEEASTIFERPTVASLSGERGQQLRYQVAVTSLDVDRVETGVGREPCRSNEVFL
jgi:hypothetical protein